MDSYLYCLSIDNGEEIWKFQVDDPIRSSPLVINNTVIFGAEDGYLYSVSAQRGDLLWRKNLGGGIRCSPTLYRNSVLTATAEGKIYCLNFESGEEKWSYDTYSNMYSSPSIIDNFLYIGGGDGYLYCLSANTGKIVWKFEIQGKVQSSPSIGSNKVVFGSWDRHVYCLNTSDGSLFWKYKTLSGVASQAAVYDGKVIIDSDDGNIYCLEEKNYYKISDKFITQRIISRNSTILRLRVIGIVLFVIGLLISKKIILRKREKQKQIDTEMTQAILDTYRSLNIQEFVVEYNMTTQEVIDFITKVNLTHNIKGHFSKSKKIYYTEKWLKNKLKAKIGNKWEIRDNW